MLSAFSVRAADAQSAGGFIKPDPRLDSTRTDIRATYIRTRDTLRLVDAASAHLSRDLRTGTNAILLSRVRAVKAACAAALRVIDPARKGLLDNEAARRAPEAKRTSVEHSLDDLRPALSSCVQQFDGFSQRPADVRNTGSGTVLAAVSASRKFELVTEAYLMSLGIKVRAFGADPSPFATSRD